MQGKDQSGADGFAELLRSKAMARRDFAKNKLKNPRRPCAGKHSAYFLSVWRCLYWLGERERGLTAMISGSKRSNSFLTTS